MAMFILPNVFAGHVNADLLFLCQDGGLSFNTVTVQGVQLFQVFYHPFRKPIPGTPCELLDLLVNDFPGRGDIVIIGGQSTDVIRGVPLKDRGGVHLFVPGSVPGTTDSAITYDVTLCNGTGYVSFDSANNCIPLPRPVILFHELTHCKFVFSADKNLIEDLVIREENNLRALIGIPARADHHGACFTDAQAQGLCQTNPNTGLSTAPGTTSGEPTIACVVTTAATGGPDSAEVEFLRWVRDTVFQQTRWGRRFLEQVHSHYYRFGPPIAKEMLEDDALREAVEWAVVAPLVNYYRLVWTRPEWNLDDCPSPLKEYLEEFNREMDCWLSKIELPREFTSLSAEEAAIELAVVLRFVLKDSDARRGYLQELSAAHALPLCGSRHELALANANLIQSGIPEDERVRIVGDAAFAATNRGD